MYKYVNIYKYIYIWYMCTIISVVLNTIIVASEGCKLPSVASIFY